MNLFNPLTIYNADFIRFIKDQFEKKFRPEDYGANNSHPAPFSEYKNDTFSFEHSWVRQFVKL